MFAHAFDFDVSPAARDELESCIRVVVAEQLGVGTVDLGPEVSLVDDLAADSLDLVEIALAIETNLGIVLPRHFLDEVRTCGELFHGTLELARGNRRPARIDREPVAVRARLTPPDDERSPQRSWVVERVLVLTPYAAESLAEDALRAGAGARLELSLAPRATESALARVRNEFARLGQRGIAVQVRREGTVRRPAA